MQTPLRDPAQAMDTLGAVQNASSPPVIPERAQALLDEGSQPYKQNTEVSSFYNSIALAFIVVLAIQAVHRRRVLGPLKARYSTRPSLR